MTSPPRIGLTTYREPATWGVWSETADVLPASYARSVSRRRRRPGAPATADLGWTRRRTRRRPSRRRAARFDPHRRRRHRPEPLWRRPPRPPPVQQRADRDGWETRVGPRSADRDLPLLGICRGMQVLDVALGGDLVPASAGRRRRRLHCPTSAARRHDVDLAADGRLAELGGHACEVATYHHQAVDGCRTAWSRRGWAEDGTSRRSRPWRRLVGGCQWHPEVADGAALFRGFVDCRSWRAFDAAAMSLGKVEALWARTVLLAGACPQCVRGHGRATRPEHPPGRARRWRSVAARARAAATFGVSRVTLREAIEALRTAGLIESRRGRGGGTFVVRRARNGPGRVGRGVDAHAASTTRRTCGAIVEPGAAALAASRTLTAADRAACRGYLPRVEELHARPPPARRLRLHMAIAALGGSACHRRRRRRPDRLTDCCGAFRSYPANIAHSDSSMRPMVEAILGRSGRRGPAEMEEHVDAPPPCCAASSVEHDDLKVWSRRPSGEGGPHAGIY